LAYSVGANNAMIVAVLQIQEKQKPQAVKF
jgi:hypothetical protein